jgi:hypothetical protein
VSVNDLAFAMKDPQSLITKLDNDLIFKLKATGLSEFHLGSDFERDDDGTPFVAFHLAIISSHFKRDDDITPNAPRSRGKLVMFTHYFHANLHPDLLTGRPVAGILHVVNQTPYDWFCKKQPTVKTATYSSKYV